MKKMIAVVCLVAGLAQAQEHPLYLGFAATDNLYTNQALRDKVGRAINWMRTGSTNEVYDMRFDTWQTNAYCAVVDTNINVNVAFYSAVNLLGGYERMSALSPTVLQNIIDKMDAPAQAAVAWIASGDSVADWLESEGVEKKPEVEP